MSDIDARLIARMRTAVAALPWTEQRVFVLHAVDEHDFATIAERLGIGVDEVERLFANALVRLGRDLGAGGR
jgi:DNA-directed RNA polymerase specialized sigma24 family protein